MCSTELVFSDDEIAVLSKIPEMAKKIKEGNSEKIRDRQPLIGAFEKFMTFIQSSYEEDGSEGNQNFLIDKNDLGELYGNCNPVPKEEESMIGELNKLANEWRELLIGQGNADLFNMDGFYPFYTSQKCRILFVGREACCMSGKNYIKTVCPCIRGDSFSGWTVNQYPFHRRQFYIAYGIMKWCQGMGFPSWEEVPRASDMAKRIFAKKEEANEGVGGLNSISWAFINLSKISNDTADYKTDSNRYFPFVSNEENRGKIREQIEILKPQIIIGANVPELIEILSYGKADQSVPECYYYEGNEKLPPFLNCYHFAAIKNDRQCFYESVKKVFEIHEEALKQYLCRGDKTK